MHTPFPLTYRFIQSGLCLDYFFTAVKVRQTWLICQETHATHMTHDVASLITEEDSYCLVEHNSFSLSH